MSDNKPLGAQISHMLKDCGVDVIFGIPGVHNQEMYRGIEEAGIRHILARHEQGAGFMADGYARASGKPGVAYVITGPGLCNIMTPMGQAFRIPCRCWCCRAVWMKPRPGAGSCIKCWIKRLPLGAFAIGLTRPIQPRRPMI